MAREQRRLVAIMAADVVGYSRLLSLDERGTLNALRAFKADLLEKRTAEHSGRIVKTTGDGFLVEFPSVVDALRCRNAEHRELMRSGLMMAMGEE